MTDDDFLEDDSGEAAASLPTVAMLIVDDEPGVHEVTRLALTGFEFQGHWLELVSAYSAGEAREILSERDYIAVILLDVVMESETAGLDLVRTIRREMGNADVRIILRTGQPGQAPEERVIVDYDINDYKAKAELTRSHLLTSITGALRSWRDIQDLHRYRRQAYTIAGRQSVLIEAVLNLVEAPAAVLDGDGLIMVANAALAARSGRTTDDLIGASLGMPDVSARLLTGEVSTVAEKDGYSLIPVRTAEGDIDAWLFRLDLQAGRSS